MIRFTTVAAACVLAFTSSSVLAAAQSSATISGLNFTLIDLNPRDGIAPSFSFLSQSGSTILSISATDNALGEADSAFSKRAGTFTFSNQFLSDLTHADASASVSGNALTASGSASGAQTSYNASASTGPSNNTYPYYNGALNLSLSANSLLLIEADVSLLASASNPSACGYYYYYCDPSESASANATLSLSYSYYQGNSSASFNDNKSVALQAIARGPSFSRYGQYNPYSGYYEEVYTSIPGTEETKSLNDVLTTVFTNSSGATQVGALGLSVVASGFGTSPAPVPEPSSYALLLTGLGVMGALANRRRTV
jgi:hypothetical protein